MTRKFPCHFIGAFLLLMLTSCAPALNGVWTVEQLKKETRVVESLNLQNLGTLTFQKDGTGTKSVSYYEDNKLQYDNRPFEWIKQADNTIRIISPFSDFNGTWNIITDQADFQKWSRMGSRGNQTIELRKN